MMETDDSLMRYADPGEIADDLAPETDQEAGEEEGDRPGGELEQPFGDAEALEHVRSCT